MLIRATGFVFAVVGAVSAVTPPAGARPMKECSANYQAAPKGNLRTQCRANAANVLTRRPPPREIRLGIGDVVSITIFEAAAGGLFIPSDAGARPGKRDDRDRIAFDPPYLHRLVSEERR
jgi:hypothetical protein